MKPIEREEVLGMRIAEVIVSMPDKPVSMSDMSCSEGYLRLENGLVLDIGACPPLHRFEAQWLRRIVRDKAAEGEFRDVLGKKVVDVRFGGVLYILIEPGQMISTVPAQFWVRPFIENADLMDKEARSIW